jgi:hypothetical protein
MSAEQLCEQLRTLSGNLSREIALIREESATFRERAIRAEEGLQAIHKHLTEWGEESTDNSVPGILSRIDLIFEAYNNQCNVIEKLMRRDA